MNRGKKSEGPGENWNKGGEEELSLILNPATRKKALTEREGEGIGPQGRGGQWRQDRGRRLKGLTSKPRFVTAWKAVGMKREGINRNAPEDELTVRGRRKRNRGSSNNVLQWEKAGNKQK